MESTEIRFDLYTMSNTHLTVNLIELDGECIGFVCENRDWNKDEKSVPLVSRKGVSIGDFHCEECAIIFMAETAVKKYRSNKIQQVMHKITSMADGTANNIASKKQKQTMRNVETHHVNPFDLILLLALREVLAEKSPR
jgi:hypothetical protein